MCACMYACVHICACAYCGVHVCAVHAHVCVHVSKDVCTRVHMCVRVCSRMYVHVCVCFQGCMWVPDDPEWCSLGAV